MGFFCCCFVLVFWRVGGGEGCVDFCFLFAFCLFASVFFLFFLKYIYLDVLNTLFILFKADFYKALTYLTAK